jgi:pimeloyl-ACP methyl ester carboxylesterase
MSDQIEIRIHGPTSGPTLIYLPGLHGDWTLIGGFRQALPPQVRFVEMIYPRTLVWSLDEYAAAIETALQANGVTSGWLLGESFGSQLVWALVGRGRFGCEGLILAGGFVRYPLPWALPLVDWLLERIPKALLSGLTFAYARILRLRYRRSSNVLKGVDEFIERRTPLDLLAARHRLKLIQQTNLNRWLPKIKTPVYMVTGFWDAIVPWPPVRRWMRGNCPALQDFRILPRADHAVLGTAPETSAQLIVEWMKRHETVQSSSS